MSSALAIASVTQVLKDILNDGLINHDVTNAVNGAVLVTALPPDRIKTDNEVSQLNLFMYLATPNSNWRNHDLPSRNSRGDRLTNPPLALDLHYLLTAYGAEELHHDILLGYGMQLLHETPVLTREAIRRSLAPPEGVTAGTLSNELVALSTSGLADQIELIKITPETLNTEEVSRLWTAFGARYRPHAAYKATVVLIESRRPTKLTLPVRKRNIYVRPFHQPVIENIIARTGDGTPVPESEKVLSGYQLVIIGMQLKGELTKVNVGGILLEEVQLNLVADNQVICPVPSALTAGVHGVQLVHEIPMGTPPVPHRGVSSNVQAFVLSPHLTDVINVTPVSGSGDDNRTVDLGLKVEPAIREMQRFVLLLNEITPPPLTPPKAYSFEIPARTLKDPPGPTNDFTIRVAGVKAGDYLVRIQVDGAESPLNYNPVSGYDGPSITIT